MQHSTNLGKGKALRTAFFYFLNNINGDFGVVTLDDDNQHLAKDVVACAKALQTHSDSLILGVRDFSDKKIPLKSRFGNKLTSWIFKKFCKLEISDTQTGLRAIPTAILEDFLYTLGNKFEYETNMLLDTKTHNIPIHEVVIETVYIDNNSGSHFRPIKDSVNIYKQIAIYLSLPRKIKKFFAFSSSAILSFLIDILLYNFLTRTLNISSETALIFTATYAARAISSIFNYTVNRNLVFKKGKIKTSFFRYYTLVIIQAFLSSILVDMIMKLFCGKSGDTYNSEIVAEVSTSVKICVDVFLFFISYKVQNKWVFSYKKPKLFVKIIKRIFAVFITFLLTILIGVYATGALICYGPSPSARDLFIHTVLETSAAKFVASLYFSKSEIDEIINVKEVSRPISEENEKNDEIEIEIKDSEVVEDIIVEDVKGETFVGKMIIIPDCNDVFIATIPEFSETSGGMSVPQLIEYHDALGGINGGAFVDVGGFGKGGMPQGVLIKNGEIIVDNGGDLTTIIGFDANKKLFVGDVLAQEAIDEGVVDAFSFGPILVKNGKISPYISGGLNPRSAIGQRKDGGILLLCINGRLPHSLGATLVDTAEVMLSYGAVNAANLDGGSSTALHYKGEQLNTNSSLVGVRPLPTAVLIKKDEENMD